MEGVKWVFGLRGKIVIGGFMLNHLASHAKQGCQMAKFDPFLSLDCARVEGGGIKFCQLATLFGMASEMIKHEAADHNLPLSTRKPTSLPPFHRVELDGHCSMFEIGLELKERIMTTN